MELTYDTKIGRGGFGDVWRATDTLGRSVAVKFFNDTSPTQAEQNAIVHARALVRVDSPAVVRVYAVERQQNPESGADSLAIIMEYVPGDNLSLHRARISTSLALAVIRDITAAIEAIHAVGLVHGDLHDGNVVITASGAKVLDILYTRSLAEVGTRTATRDRNDDLRDLAGILRQVVERTGHHSPNLMETYYRATTALRSAAQIGEAFTGLLAPAANASRIHPRSIETRVDQMTEEDFAALLGSVDDEDDSHILWVTRSGHARLSPTGDLTPAGFEAAHESEMQFRWETFGRGNGYCGADAASDANYVAEKLAELREDWRQRKTGYIDY